MRACSPRLVCGLCALVAVHCSVDDRLTGVTEARDEPGAGQGGSGEVVPGESVGGSAGTGTDPSCGNACTEGASECTATGVQRCQRQASGCTLWVATSTCGPNQTCRADAGTVSCVCNAGACSQAGMVCQDAFTLATCGTDESGCLAVIATSPCEGGACSGNACCSNSCTVAPAQCGSSSSLEACEVGANGCTSLVSTDCAAGLVCERAGTAACADPNWAEWPMPNAVQDANDGAPNQESYVNNMDGTATDNRTRLMWQTGTSPSTVSWGSVNTVGTAQAYCSGLSLGGFDDWRLPALVELFSLLDIGANDPGNGRIISLFPTPTDTFFWSSTPSASDSGAAWSMYYSAALDALNNQDSVSAEGLARCVR